MDAQAYQLDAPLLAEADTEARQLGHPYLGPEHLLLAVAAHANGASGAFLDRHGLTAQALRDSVAAVLGPTAQPEGAPRGPRKISLRSLVALGHAVSAGQQRGRSTAYTPDDLLLALLADDVAPDAVVGAVFARAGLTAASARAEVATLAAGDAAT